MQHQGMLPFAKGQETIFKGDLGQYIQTDRHEMEMEMEYGTNSSFLFLQPPQRLRWELPSNSQTRLQCCCVMGEHWYEWHLKCPRGMQSWAAALFACVVSMKLLVHCCWTRFELILMSFSWHMTPYLTLTIPLQAWWKPTTMSSARQAPPIFKSSHCHIIEWSK